MWRSSIKCQVGIFNFRIGRSDSNTSVATTTALPSPHHDINDIRTNLIDRLGLSPEEVVALIGNRTLGFINNEEDCKGDRWSRNPWVFDNNYFQELIDPKSPYLKTKSDIAVLDDDEFRKIVEDFAKNQTDFFKAFQQAYEKVSDYGYENLLIENASLI